MIAYLIDRICRTLGLGVFVNRQRGRIPALSYDDTVGFEAFNARCLTDCCEYGRRQEDSEGVTVSVPEERDGK